MGRVQVCVVYWVGLRCRGWVGFRCVSCIGWGSGVEGGSGSGVCRVEQGWATFIIKRTTFFIITIRGPHDCAHKMLNLVDRISCILVHFGDGHYPKNRPES